MRTHTTVESPIGPLTLVAEDRVLCGLYLAEHRRAPDPATHGPADPAGFEALTEALAGYFAGQVRVFDVPVAAVGTPFQQRVWAALREIPYGQTATYGELAAALGSPGASRAVGAANARNPVSIVVPCHRVVGAGGAITGYAGGLARKRALLDLEAGRPALALA
jgi:methylated-DNA-[protein]-cysteine S-methyltransferase